MSAEVETMGSGGSLSPRVAVAQLGARHHYAVPRILHEAGMLERFFTDSYSGKWPMLRRLIRAAHRSFPSDPVARWLARMDPRLPTHKVTAFERLGVAFAAARRRSRGRDEDHAIFVEFASRFGDAIVRSGFGGANVAFGYDTASIEVFRAAKAQGLLCVLDQTIVPRRLQRRLMQAELTRWPDWQPDLRLGDADEQLAEREQIEWELADVILCPSPFVKSGIVEADGPCSKCVMVPYGVEVPLTVSKPESLSLDRRPLRLLFAGEVGLRKGAPYFLEAVRSLGASRVEARLVGAVRLDPAKLGPYAGTAWFVGAVPRPQMAAHYAWADVFVLPSLCEGSATVLSEALAHGLPVICTPNSGPPPSSGGVHVVEAGDIAGIVAAIEHIRGTYEASLPATHEAPEFGVTAYGQRLVCAVRTALQRRAT